MRDLTPPPGRPAELLLVEDNDGDVLLAREALESARIVNRLSVAADGEQALDMLRRAGPYRDHPRPDLILLDLNLPRKDGRELLRDIRADADLKSIPVIVMSGSAAELDYLRRSELNADGYSVKPMTIDSLQAILAALDGFGLAIVVGERAAQAGRAHAR